MENLIINICIGLIVVIGFFWYWGKTSGVFKDGGVRKEWGRNRLARKKEEKMMKKNNDN